ncbi:hypothetical protein MGN70_005099 [Eutypa lata]|nr:hypothetical protein MGN70_005099 [Eutypa lata]
MVRTDAGRRGAEQRSRQPFRDYHVGGCGGTASNQPEGQCPFSTLGYEVFGEQFVFGGSEGEPDVVLAPKPGQFEFANMFWEVVRDSLALGMIKTARPIVNRGGKGLEGVLVGLDELGKGREKEMKNA